MIYPIINENGIYYLTVVTKSENIDNTYTDFYYLYENPVTPEKTTKTEVDPETGEETEVEVITYSKLEMRKEPIEYLESGGARVIKNLSGIDHWLIKMPKDFLIKREYQPGLDKPKVEQWSIGGTYQKRESAPRSGYRVVTKTTLPFLAKRAQGIKSRYQKSSGSLAFDPTNNWRTDILNLLNQKYN